MSEQIITCRKWDQAKGVYISDKTSIESPEQFRNSFSGRLHNNGKYEYRLIENGQRVASFKSNDRL